MDISQGVLESEVSDSQVRILRGIAEPMYLYSSDADIMRGVTPRY